MDEACVDWCAGDEPLALHPLCGAAPVMWRCTRYVALHPNRRGVMPTVRVHCPSEQVKVWSVCAEVTVSHRGEDCLVTVACGLVDMIDLAKAQLTLVTVACGLVCRGRAAGDAPVMWRCTRYVALHPNRRGVMPTVRVHCPSEQVKVWSVCAEVTVSHRGEDCLVTQRGAPRGVFNCLCIRRFV